MRLRPLSRVGLAACLLALASPAAAGGGCPLRFDAVTVGMPRTCLFVGRYNPDCGGEAVAVFAGDGKSVVVGLTLAEAKPVVYLPGRVESGTEGTVVRWRPDLQLREAEGAGRLTLERDGETLRVRLIGQALQVGACPLREFVGRFVTMVDATGGTSADLAVASDH